MFSQLRPALFLFALLMLITGIAYPLAMTGVAQALFPGKANGSLVVLDGKVRGSALLGQTFADNRYFWPRISAAGSGYDASASSGANLGPTSKKLIERIAADAERIKAADGVQSLPPDAATASASGLDPQISPAYALQQVGRVAKARNLAEERVRGLVESHIYRPVLGIFGEPRVSVLSLNIALDALGAG
ncbi:potassium-transporting ATPase subunit KdpC [Nordella sp. HKS 07]|uniref:potassium-transporting ATPase subunit KdpC n=1 Tax=Nordella sp. HKS 07 TaxID=2712222 RepID=UPI0013E18355|nr:potassium-transporting ATPase subunit KdpC [Nordella sp. HKS 07]QIG52224.1 potassium-transporting ATPase subunit KdpC [Nordella sp. HKS 07]